MTTGWSERIREVADRDYVRPARAQRGGVRIRFGDLQRKMQELGLPQQHLNQVASAIETSKFWEPLGLEMCSPKGQPRKVDSVFEFKFSDLPVDDGNDPMLELVGMLDGAIEEGVEVFMKNIRRDRENVL